VARVGGVRGIDEQECHDLHQRQQGNEEDDDPIAKAAQHQALEAALAQAGTATDAAIRSVRERKTYMTDGPRNGWAIWQSLAFGCIRECESARFRSVDTLTGGVRQSLKTSPM